MCIRDRLGRVAERAISRLTRIMQLGRVAERPISRLTRIMQLGRVAERPISRLTRIMQLGRGARAGITINIVITDVATPALLTSPSFCLRLAALPPFPAA